MTADELGAMTLVEIEALAARLSAAAAAMREMRSLMGAQAAPSPLIGPNGRWPPDDIGPPGALAAMTDEQAVAAHRLRQFQPVESVAKGSKLTAAEQAEKARLLGRRIVDPNLPPEIAEMESQ